MILQSGPREQAAWNINAAQSQFIAELVKKATNFYLNKHFDDWFWTLTALRENINHDLTDGKGRKDSKGKIIPTSNEREELDILEKTIMQFKLSLNSALKLMRQSKNNIERENQTQKLSLIRYKYIQSIKTYERRLGDLLKQLGYLPPKEDRTKLSF